MSPQELERQAHALIADKVKAQETVKMQWAVTELIGQQCEISGDDDGFYRLVAYEYTYRVIKKVVDKYDKDNGAADDQLTLEGYDCLQCAYTVKREGERQLIPVSLVTDKELLDRAAEFEKQAAGMVKHAREIRLFVESRQVAAAS